MSVDDRIPPFLTVEEASRLLKIGRTKAYDLTKEWRATGGRSGLPVVDLGDVLRVPARPSNRCSASAWCSLSDGREPGREHDQPARPYPTAPGPTLRRSAAAEPEPAAAVQVPTGSPSPSGPPVRTRSQRRRPTNQLPLFQSLTPTNPTPRHHPPTIPNSPPTMNPTFPNPTPERSTDSCHPSRRALPGAAAFSREAGSAC